jgi:circadian clock protein KaiC
MVTDVPTTERLGTGVAGLDAILGGGLPRNRLYLVHGEPGCGKTTLALQFLLEGVRAGEPVLFVTLSETRDELEAVARSHGWTLDGVGVFEVRASEESLKPEEQYTAFHPSEVELGGTVQTLLDEVSRVKPARLVIDSLSEMRLLARDPLRYRRQVAALKQVFLGHGSTVLFLDDLAARVNEHQFQTLAHGVVLLERYVPAYGRERRRLQVTKLRGVEFHGGYHDFAIRRGGMHVFPCLVAAEHRRPPVPGRVESGVAELDALLGGGPTRGTSTLVLGPAGAGKSTVCLQYALAAAARGEHATVYSFDEGLETILARSAALGMDVHPPVEAGLIDIQQIDPAMLSPGEFMGRVRRAVERGTRVVVIDSLNGYLNAMPGEKYLVIQMHELLTYLAQQGVLTLVVMAQHGLVGRDQESPVDVSYLADVVLLLRYFEHGGRVRKAISVVKNRAGRHEDAIRELQIGPVGVRVGEPLTAFRGVLTGTPDYTGRADPLMGGGGHDA